MSGLAITFREVPPDHPDAQACLTSYFAELDRRFDEGFDPAGSAAPTLAGFALPDGSFLVAYEKGRPLACGGFKRLDPRTAYVKRMWVDPDARGRGLGKQLLDALEANARALGFTRACLDTHRSLVEALTLYRRLGYRDCAPLADEAYADHWLVKEL